MFNSSQYNEDGDGEYIDFEPPVICSVPEQELPLNTGTDCEKCGEISSEESNDAAGESESDCSISKGHLDETDQNLEHNHLEQTVKRDSGFCSIKGKDSSLNRQSTVTF